MHKLLNVFVIPTFRGDQWGWAAFSQTPQFINNDLLLKNIDKMALLAAYGNLF